jgi:hypothetical protein
MALILDIETVPTERGLAAPYPSADRTPPANYKSDEAIARWREADRAKWEQERAKECSLNPRLGRVLCCGMMHEGGEPFVAYAAEADEEANVLRAFWRELRAAEGHVVTWNGAWDLRFLVMRSLHHGLTPSVPSDVVRSWFRKYSTAPHCDVKALLLNWEVRVAGEGLSEWCEFLSLPGKTEGLSGADVWPLFQADHHEEIADYCLQDVAATAALYERVAPMLGGVGFASLSYSPN